MIYRSNVLDTICADLGIRLTFAQPYSPEGKGKIEKFWDFVQSDFIKEVRDSGVRNLQELNECFWAWLEVVYHQKVHSETGKKPVDAFDAIGSRLILPDPIKLQELFLLRDTRLVQPKTSTVSVNGILFEVDPSLRRKRVEVRYDPFDLTRVYIYHRSQRIQTARPYQMNQPPHPTPEKQLRGNLPPSINYLHLLKAQYDELILNQTKLVRYEQIKPSDDFTLQRFLALLAKMLARQIQSFDEEDLTAAQDLWERFGPLEETISRIALEQALSFRGYDQHISVYLDTVKIFHLKRRT